MNLLKMSYKGLYNGETLKFAYFKKYVTIVTCEKGNYYAKCKFKRKWFLYWTFKY